MERLGSGPIPNAEFPLLEFVDDASVVVGGVEIRRRQVVKYVSNRLGGAHLDRRRGTTKDGMIYDLLDKVADKYMLLEKSAIYFELLSIGQALVNSSDLTKFEEHANDLSAEGASA
ncbi:MAG: hypothetical protein IIA89_09830 [Chloroflexi bacterium]|nr:hypothetical protein [Chloroflexota bacterium]